MTPSITLTASIGPDTAPLVVLGPSLGTSTILWSRVIPLLCARYRLVAWDLPGHGSSAAATAPYSLGELADAVVESVGEPFHYSGVSLGGCVGLEILLRHPDRVNSAAIVASGAAIGEATAWQDRAALVRAQSTSALIAGSAQRWFAPGTPERDPDLAGRLLHALQDADDESYALACEALATFDVRDRLGEIAHPIVAVWGAHDIVTPEASALEIARGVRNGRTTSLPGASHLPPIDDPAGTAGALLALFDGASPASTADVRGAAIPGRMTS